MKLVKIGGIHVNKVLKEIATMYARLINQYKFKDQTVFSARFEKQDGEDQVLGEIELYKFLNTN